MDEHSQSGGNGDNDGNGAGSAVLSLEEDETISIPVSFSAVIRKSTLANDAQIVYVAERVEEKAREEFMRQVMMARAQTNAQNAHVHA